MKRIGIALLLIALIAVSACGKKDGSPGAGHGDHGGGHEQAGTGTLETKASWQLDKSTLKPGAQTKIGVSIKDGSGKAVEQFDINHEKKMHLIVVSKDLSYFSHIHPVYKSGGQFEVETAFPQGGEYKLIADYIPTGGSATTQMEWIQVEGDSAQPKPLVPSESLVDTADGVEVTLRLDHPEAGHEAELDFKLADAASKEPVTDLQPYLGAVGHVVILSENSEQYLHVHPMDEKAKGPDAKFMTTFPNAGIYKIWGQFQRDGKVMTVSYVVQVK